MVFRKTQPAIPLFVMALVSRLELRIKTEKTPEDRYVNDANGLWVYLV
jgi:hypothetical protein